MGSIRLGVRPGRGKEEQVVFRHVVSRGLWCPAVDPPDPNSRRDCLYQVAR
jgi:hypothetical protein